MQESMRVPFVLRGEIIDDCTVEHGGRHGQARFLTPDIECALGRLPLREPSRMADLYSLTMDDIVEYLARLGKALDVRTNRHMQEAFALSCRTSGLSEPILRHYYELIPQSFEPAVVREMAERLVAIGPIVD